jgi:cyclic pyranopterin phosphate synthase
MDKFRIDSHKLIYHIKAVNSWLSGSAFAPIYVEIAPSGACNHRCVYCALDYMEYQPRFLDTALLKKRLSEMAALGTKSVMYAGEGEPLLHKDIVRLIRHTKKSGIDVALTTNGVLFNKKLADATLGSITWVKVSINALNPATYARIHKTSPDDLGIVLKNLSYAVSLKKSKGYKCTLGMQLLLLPENAKEVIPLAKKAKALGLDYFVVKPYSHHHFSKTTRYKNIQYNSYLHLADKLRVLNSNKFSAIFRLNTMKKWDQAIRTYRHCYALPFWAYIDAGGNVWGCSAYLGDKRFIYGNIYENGIRKIWQSVKRKNLVKMARDKLNTGNCRVNCRMDEINRYLWELRHPPEHVNFI